NDERLPRPAGVLSNARRARSGRASAPRGLTCDSPDIHGGDADVEQGTVGEPVELGQRLALTAPDPQPFKPSSQQHKPNTSLLTEWPNATRHQSAFHMISFERSA